MQRWWTILLGAVVATVVVTAAVEVLLAAPT